MNMCISDVSSRKSIPYSVSKSYLNFSFWDRRFVNRTDKLHDRAAQPCYPNPSPYREIPGSADLRHRTSKFSHSNSQSENLKTAPKDQHVQPFHANPCCVDQLPMTKPSQI